MLPTPKPGEAWRSCAQLVQELLSPPQSAYTASDRYDKVILDCLAIQFRRVQGVLSEKHFVNDPAHGMSVLRKDSKLRTHGKLYGPPKRYYDWLCEMDADNREYMVTRDVF